MILPLDMRVIYALVDPRDGLVRYVGVTRNPSSRFSQHLRMPSSEGSQKNDWIKSLKDISMTPVFVFLDTVKDTAADETELEWIKHFSTLGVLFNHKMKNSFSPPCKKENT